MSKSKPVWRRFGAKVFLQLFVFLPLLHLFSTPTLAKWSSFPVSDADITSIAADPGNSNTVYAGTAAAGVFKTTDAGASWAPARGGLSFYPIRSLAVDPVHNNVIYAGTNHDGVWKSTDGGTSWVNLSNGLPGLIVFRLLIDPSHPDTVYAAMGGGVALQYGNIYKSVNGGLTWERKDSGIPSNGDYTLGAVLTLALDPDSPAKLYAATRNVSGSTTPVFASWDGGETWTPFNQNLDFQSGNVKALAVDRHHGGRPAACIDSMAGYEKRGYYVYDSLSGWQKVATDFEPNDPSYLYFHPLNPNIIYASGNLFQKSVDGGKTWRTRDIFCGELALHPEKPDTIYGAFRSFTSDNLELEGVFKSSDQGATWAFASSGINGAEVRSVAIDPASHNIMYFGSGPGGNNLMRTEDSGKTWHACPIPMPPGSPYPNDYLFGEILDIRIAPAKPSVVYVAGMGLFKSSDRGKTFTRITQIVSPFCIAIDPVNPEIVYTNNYVGAGVYKTADGGQTWQLLQNGLPAVEIYALAVDPSRPATIWAGTLRDVPGVPNPNNGVYRSLDGGGQWQAKLKLSDAMEEIMALAVHPRNSSIVMAGVGNRFGGPGKILQTIDGGDTWNEVRSGISTPYAIIFDPRDARTLYAAVEMTGVLHSSDGGNTWSPYNEGIFYPNVSSLAASTQSPYFLIAGSYGSGLYYSRSLSKSNPPPGMMLLLE